MPDLVPAYWLYGERREARFPDALHIETITARSSVHDWRIEPHRHQNMYQFFLIREGGGQMRIDGADHMLTAGSAFMIPPLAIHDFVFSTETEGFVASTAELTLERFFQAEPEGRAVMAHPLIARLERETPHYRALEGTMRAALDEFGRGGPYRDGALLAYTELLAVWFLRAALRETAKAELALDPRALLVRRFVAEVETGFRTPRALPAYARTLGVSVPHLSRTCRELLGRSATRIIHDRQMLEARRHLVYTSMPISQIAFELGFSDPAYFSRFFTARAGITPSAYRAAC